MSKIKSSIIIIFFILGAYAFGHLSKTNEQKVKSEPLDYLQISDEDAISDSLKKDDFVHTEKVTVESEELETLVKDFLCNEFKDYCGLRTSTLQLNLDSVDLNADNVKEYISMPNSQEDFFRGASGNGPILIIQLQKEGPIVIAEMRGNSYIVLNKRVNDYYIILTHNHSSAASGTETLYQRSKGTFGVEQFDYLEVLTKWYRR